MEWLFGYVRQAIDFFPRENVYWRAFSIVFVFYLLSIFVKLFFLLLVSRAVKTAKIRMEDKLLHALEQPLFLILNITGVFAAGSVLGFGGGQNFTRLFLTFQFLAINLLLYRILKIGIHFFRWKVEDKNALEYDKQMYPFVRRMLKVCLLGFYAFIFFRIWGIDVTPLLASAGIAGLAIALAAKDTIANILGGISVYLDKNYKPGDYIVVDNQDRGEVIDIGMRTTKLRTFDNVLISIPNAIMASSKIINESGHNPKLRLRIPLDVSYGTDLEKLEKLLLELARKADYIEKNPEPTVRIMSFKAYSVGLELRVWIKSPRLKARYQHYILKDIYRAFKRHGVHFPYPVTDVHMTRAGKIWILCADEYC